MEYELRGAHLQDAIAKAGRPQPLIARRQDDAASAQCQYLGRVIPTVTDDDRLYQSFHSQGRVKWPRHSATRPSTSDPSCRRMTRATSPRFGSS